MGYILGPNRINKGVSIHSRDHEPPVMNSLWQVWLLLALCNYVLAIFLRLFVILLFLIWSIYEGYDRDYKSDNLFYNVFLFLDRDRKAFRGKEMVVSFDDWLLCLFQLEDSNSKVARNDDVLPVEDNTDSISSILRKEFEGKVIISKIKTPSSLAEEKESLGETFLDAKEELMSGTSLASLQKEIDPIQGKHQAHMMEIDRKTSNRKRKTVDTDENMLNNKLAR